MRKTFCIFVCILVLVISICPDALANGENNYDWHLYRLECLGVLPKYEGERTATVTRRQAISALVQIYFAGGIDFEVELSAEENNLTEISGIIGYAKDAKLLSEATGLGYLKGRISEKDGKKYAELEREVTTEEVLIMTLRLLGGKHVDEELEKRQQEEQYQNSAFAYAQEIGLINAKSVTEWGTFEDVAVISSEEMEEFITFEDFVEIIHRSLYIPTWCGYDGEEINYRINMFTTTQPTGDRQFLWQQGEFSVYSK